LLPVWSAAAALRAVRAAVVMPAVFAFSLEVAGNRQMALFAAFGGFATLVLASFGGTRRDKLVAHLLLAVTGSVLLTIGTAVNSSVVVAAIVTLLVTFLVFFAGVCGPNAASGGVAALLAYVLPAASPGTISMVPDRLAGWWLASVAGTAAVLMVSPRSEGQTLRATASRLASELAGELEAALAGTATAERLDACIAAKHELMSAFTSTPYRPMGLATADQALSNMCELLEWCTSLIVDAMHEHSDLQAAAAADRALLESAAATLRGVVSLLDGGGVLEPDLDQLEHLRTQSSAHMGTLTPDGAGFRAAVQLAFHAQTTALAVRSLTADALVSSGRADVETIAIRRRYWYGGSAAAAGRGRRLSGLAGAANVALGHASVRSVWFINSARAALAIAAAVTVADVTNVQHGFWVVLGTLSVLRTNAAGTGHTALRALAGTAIGFVIGGALLLAIGTSATALWIALPVAVLVAGYAPGTAPFAVGQAAFTIVVAVLFNLLVPVGWKVGVLRVEDVAIGCAVSVAVGILFWPRGVSGVVGDDLADAFRRGSTYLTQGVDWAVGLLASEPDGAVAVTTAALRLDDAVRGFLAEQGSKRVHKLELWRLIGGLLRLHLSARSLARLPRGVAGPPEARPPIVERTHLLCTWYESLAAHVDRPRRGGGRVRWPAQPPAIAWEPVELAAGSHHACYAIWVQELLQHLSQHLSDIASAAEHVAEVRQRPWWR
jgi:uncharacterized membrane protein YccC